MPLNNAHFFLTDIYKKKMKHIRLFEEFIYENDYTESFKNWYDKQSDQIKKKILNKAFDPADVREYDMITKDLRELELSGWGVGYMEMIAKRLNLFKN